MKYCLHMKELTATDILLKSLIKGYNSGKAGAIAGTIQVLSFMWLRTIMNYQYQNGGGTIEVIKKLYKEGGVSRFYQGLLPWAIIQAPLCRFGDTATNTGILALTMYYMPHLPTAIQTMCTTTAGSIWRISLTPIETIKTAYQVQGLAGRHLITKKLTEGGILRLWDGAQANFAANWLGSFPWFMTMNVLNKAVPVATTTFGKIARNGLIGCVCSCVSDTVSNFLRVLKTKRQSSDKDIGYLETINEIVLKDGISGLFFRGLGTRLFTNVLQSSLFTVLWKLFEQRYHS